MFPDWQVHSIELFIRTADLLGLPTSLGQVYGLLFSTDSALHLDTFQRSLGISKVCTSQALNPLRRRMRSNPFLFPQTAANTLSPSWK